MINRNFHFRLRKLKDSAGLPWTVGRMAETIYVSRPRLNDALNNKTGHGGRTRTKVVKFLERHLPEQKADLLQALGWDGDGNILPSQGST